MRKLLLRVARIRVLPLEVLGLFVKLLLLLVAERFLLRTHVAVLGWLPAHLILVVQVGARTEGHILGFT